MRGAVIRRSLYLALIVLCAPLLVAGCGGGGASLAPHPAISPGRSGPGTVSFKIVVPPKPGERHASGLRHPRYVSPGTASVSIAIVSQGGTKFPTIQATKQNCAPSGGTCTFVAATTLPPDGYTITITAADAHAKALSFGTFAQTISPGPNVVAVTLGGVVANVAIGPSSIALQPGASNPQVVPLTVTPYDADGFQIVDSGGFYIAGPGGVPTPGSVYVTESEMDTVSAVSLVPGTSGNAQCGAPKNGDTGFICALSSTDDTVSLVFNGQGSGFPTSPNYFPTEALVSGSISTSGPFTLGPTNTLVAYSGPCAHPAPICVYSRLQYPLVLQQSPAAQPFTPSILAAGGSGIWTDAGRVTFGSPPTFDDYGIASSQFVTIPAITYDAGSNAAWFPTLGFSGPEQLAKIATNLQVSYFTYPPAKGSSSLGGENILFGPDGKLWWIDPTIGILRSASTAAPKSALSCALDVAGQPNVLLSALLLAASPAGAPGRLWFSAIDDNTGNEYIGYVADAANGQNSCPNATVAQIGTGSSGAPPLVLTVDGSGNGWYVDGALSNAIGEASVRADGSIALGTPIPLPSKFATIVAFGLTYDPGDGNLYVAMDSGLIGRFAPGAGPSTAVAFAVPGPLVEPFGFSSTPLTGVGVTWQAGTGPGLLWFALSDVLNSQSPSPPLIPALDSSAVVGFDLSGLSFNANGPAVRPRFHRMRVRPHSRV